MSSNVVPFDVDEKDLFDVDEEFFESFLEITEGELDKWEYGDEDEEEDEEEDFIWDEDDYDYEEENAYIWESDDTELYTPSELEGAKTFQAMMDDEL